MTEQRQYITEIKKTLWLAGPVIGSQLGQMSMGFVDTLMVGRLGVDELAGIALGNTIFFVLLILTSGVLLSVGPMVSQAYGAKDKEGIERSVSEGLRMGILLIIFPFLLIWNIGPLLLMMGQDPATVALTTGYLRAIVWGMLPLLWFAVLRGFVEGISRPFPVTLITLVGLGVNVLANYVLMFGKWGFPELGLVGTGWASTVVYWMMFTLIIGFIRWSDEFKQFRIFSRLGKIDSKVLKEIFNVGWPIGISHGIEAGLFSFTALMMGLLGTVALASHQVAIQCAAYTFMVPMGIGIAASVRVGQAIGREDYKAAQRAGYVALGIATVFMTITAILFLLFPRQIVGLYIDVNLPENSEVVSLAVILLGIAAIFQIFDGIQAACLGALRGLKDTKVPMVLAFVSYWLIGLSVGLGLAFGLDMGAEGLWWGLVLGLAAAALMLTLRFRHSAKKSILEKTA